MRKTAVGVALGMTFFIIAALAVWTHERLFFEAAILLVCIAVLLAFAWAMIVALCGDRDGHETRRAWLREKALIDSQGKLPPA